MARYLTEIEVGEALRRGATLEQLLGVRLDAGDRVLSWIELDVDRQRRFVVTEFHVFDDQIEGFDSVHAFEPFDPDHPYGDSREFDEFEQALEYAVSLGASRHKFMNAGFLEEEYRKLRTTL